MYKIYRVFLINLVNRKHIFIKSFSKIINNMEFYFENTLEYLRFSHGY